MITVICFPEKDYKRIEFKPFQQDSSVSTAGLQFLRICYFCFHALFVI